MEIIAELGSNWFAPSPNDARDLALRAIDEAAQAGATGIKVQMFRAASFYAESRSRFSEQENKKLAGIRCALRDYELPEDLFIEMSEKSHAAGLKFWASFFSVDLLEKFATAVDGIKIASGDIDFFRLTDLAGKLAKKHDKDVCFSTGAAIWPEIQSCARVLGSHTRYVAMHCVSAYPASLKDMNLAILNDMHKLPKVKAIGLSDHTLDATAAMISVGMGVTYFEKHFRPIGANPNPDYETSVNPSNLLLYVRSLKLAQEAVGYSKTSSEYRMPASEMNERVWARRGLDEMRPR